MESSAKVICDSVSPNGIRLTTLQLVMHRFVLAEFNTHRVFSRNSASSRAIPLTKQVTKVEHTPAIPVKWPAEQKGMQGGDEITLVDDAYQAWLNAADDAVIGARRLGALGVHKSIANRLLEPFMWHTVVVSSTAWANFMEQRDSALAQPEIQRVAEQVRDVMTSSTPRFIDYGMWHLPYIDQETITAVEELLLAQEGQGKYGKHTVTRYLAQISAARCARVSYETQEGKRDISADLDLYDRLEGAKPWHGSPLEHPATPDPTNHTTATLAFCDLNGVDRYVERDVPLFGNFIGWRQLRLEAEAAYELEPLR